MFRQLLAGFWSDAVKPLRVVAPLLSVAYTLLKLSEVSVELNKWSYAWALLPLLVWVGFAYVGRWRESSRLESELEPKLTLDFDQKKCVRDVEYGDGRITRYVSVLLRASDGRSVANTAVYLHSIEYHHAKLGSDRVDIEGSPPLEWAQSSGPVSAHEPRTLHAGREALINVLYCAVDIPSISEIFICSPQRLLREEGLMGLEGTYRVEIRASGEGVGRFAAVVLKVGWNGNDPESLRAEVWTDESLFEFPHEDWDEKLP